MSMIKFVRNHDDQSTERGFQFEFYCDRCGSGYRTRFQSSGTGLVTEALDVAGGIFGGLLGNVADVGDRIHSAAWERAHDKAFEQAVQEAMPYFKQCRRCGQWVDQVCWNAARGLCFECAPDTEAEFAAAQVEAEIEQARVAAAEVQYVTKERFKETIKGGCPECGATLLPGAKFCPECGARLATERFCTECGSKVPAGAKFCSECGTKQ
jgi:ribosomal protein L40E